jgi:predicted  nucleic acid-binding Zn-ribbon protein
MDSILDLLVEIQRFDDEVESTAAKLTQIPQEIAKLDRQITAREEDFKSSEHKAQDLKKTYKLKEIDITDNEEKIGKFNTQTFAVKTNEEYRALLNEIEFLKKHNRETEDEMIRILEEEEKIMSTIDRLRAETSEYVTRTQARIAELRKEIESLQEQQNVARINLENNYAKLPGDVKELYDRIAKVRERTVCLITDNTCTGCYANLPHQFLNELKKRNKVLLCDNCGRILVFVDSEK